MLEKEKITDLIISDIMVTPEIREEIEQAKEEFGLRNVIYLHSLMGGPTVGPAELTYNEWNYHMLRRRPDTLFMNDLLVKYADAPIRYDESSGDRTAFIAHTSGTTHGTRKLLPFTDKVMNDTLNLIPGGFHSFVEGTDAGKPFRILQTFDFSSVMAISGQLLGPLSIGDAVVLTFFGFMHPKFIRAIDYYDVDVVLITGFMADKWMERDDLDGIGFSSLKVLGMSGGYITPEKMEQYREFFRARGYQHDIAAAYGMSEAGGKPMFAPKDNDRDILGFEEDTESVRIQDEDDGKFYRIEDGTRTGLLYRQSETRCGNELDGEVLFEYTEIDGKQFLCTNDLVRVNEDGSLSFAGRADKYFVNNEGKKFDSGVVDLHMAAHPAVDCCAVVPVMEKRIHDTVPVLYVIPAEKGSGAAEAIHRAFLDVYVKEQKIPGDNLPTQFMLVDDIPLNPNGKLDIFRITRERLQGDAYNLIPVFEDGELTDVRMEHVERLNSMTGGTLPEGMENNSAYNMYDLFNAGASGGGFTLSDLLKPWKLFMPDKPEKKHFKMPEIPESVTKAVLKYGNRLSGIPNGRRSMDFDFED